MGEKEIMWYKIDSISHPKFQDFLAFDNRWCAIQRGGDLTTEMWNDYLTKENPSVIWFYDDETYIMYNISVYKEHLGGHVCVYHGIDFKVPFTKEIETQCLHIIGQWYKDRFTKGDMKKFIREDIYTEKKIVDDDGWQLVIDKAAIVDESREDEIIYAQYGVKTTRYIDNGGIRRIAHELM